MEGGGGGICESKSSQGRAAPSALSEPSYHGPGAPANPKLGARGPSPRRQGAAAQRRWSLSKLWCDPGRVVPRFIFRHRSFVFCERMEIWLSKSLRRQSSPRTGQAEAGASEPDSSGPREAGSTWTSLWSSMRCEPGAGWWWQA